MPQPTRSTPTVEFPRTWGYCWSCGDRLPPTSTLCVTCIQHVAQHEPEDWWYRDE